MHEMPEPYECCLQAASLAKKGLHELDAVLSHVAVLGCKFPVSDRRSRDNANNVASWWRVQQVIP